MAADAALIKAVTDSYYNSIPPADMYDGLDKITKSLEAVMERKQLLLKEEKNKNARQEAGWKEICGDVHAKLGSFNSKTDYDYYFNEIQSLKGDLFAAQNEVPPNQKGITAATLAVNNLKEEVNDTVDLRATWAEAEDEGIGMSNAMKGTNYLGGNDGRDVTIVTEWMKENYVVSKDDKNERVYTFEQGDLPEGTQLSYTKKELEEMYIPTNEVAPLAYKNLLDQYSNKRFVNEDSVRTEIDELLPKDAKGLRAFIADKSIGNITFLQRLDTDEGVRSEINKTLKNDPMFDTDDTPGISDIEFEAYKQAIVDPYSEVWKVNGVHEKGHSTWDEYARKIITDSLYYGVANQVNARQEIVVDGDEVDGGDSYEEITGDE